MNLINTMFFILVVVFSLLGLAVSPFLLLGTIFIAAVFLFLRRGGVLKDQDEMQEFLDYKSGYYSFYFVIFVATIFLVIKLLKNPANVPPDLAVIILLPLIFKFAVQSFEYKNYKRAGFIISLLPGIFWFIFVFLEYISQGFSTGFFIEILPVLLIIAFSVLGLKFPRFSGTVLLLISFFFLFILAKSKLPAMTKIGVSSFLPLPLILSGFFYIFSKKEEVKNE